MGVLLLTEEENVGDVYLYGTDILEKNLPCVSWSTYYTENGPCYQEQHHCPENIIGAGIFRDYIKDICLWF